MTMSHIRLLAVFLTTVLLSITSIPTVEARVKQYDAMQVGDFVVDGNLDEWGTDDPVIVLNELKDVGAKLPDPDDFVGEVMVGWNSSDPKRVYLAYAVIDDELQDINPANDQWWNDDSAEIIFDFDNDGTRTKFVVGATGQLGATSTPNNTEFAIIFDDPTNQYIYEIAITGITGFKADAGGTVGLSPIYNDCENGVREHQVGWIAGAANDSNNMGDINFVAQTRTPISVEPSGRIAAVWGALKSH
jgi:hypothetical protein